MSKQQSKQSYIKPEVTKHGNVEELTKVVGIGSSSSPVVVAPPVFSFPFSFPFFFNLK